MSDRPPAERADAQAGALFGWYSARMARRLSSESCEFDHDGRLVTIPPMGGSYYSTPDGGEVLVTAVTARPDHGLGWDDVEERGPVVKWLRSAPPVEGSGV